MVILLQTYYLPLRVRIMSGQICMTVLPRMQKKKDSKNWPRNSAELLQLKSHMKSAIANY